MSHSTIVSFKHYIVITASHQYWYRAAAMHSGPVVMQFDVRRKRRGIKSEDWKTGYPAASWGEPKWTPELCKMTIHWANRGRLPMFGIFIVHRLIPIMVTLASQYFKRWNILRLLMGVFLSKVTIKLLLLSNPVIVAKIWIINLIWFRSATACSARTPAELCCVCVQHSQVTHNTY